MRAWQIQSYGGPEVFELIELPDPAPKPGWVHIAVKAFGINRSELYTRQGHSGDAVTIPRVLGIECVGEVIDGGGTDLQPGQNVACAMGDMGRLHHGGYAEQTLIPRSNVFPVRTNLDWTTFGAIPEMYFTAWGAAIKACGLKAGQSLLIRGGTSSVGLACVSIAKDLGCTVLSTTRSEKKAEVLRQKGVDHVIMDHGHIAEEVMDLTAGGVHASIGFVGTETTIKDNLLAVRPGGTHCMVGFLGNQWGYTFFPWMPSTVKLTIYSSETLHSDQDTVVLQTIVDKVEAGAYDHHIFEHFDFERLPDTHVMMEANRALGKLVVSTTSDKQIP